MNPNLLAASTLPYLNIELEEAAARINDIGFAGLEIYYEGKHSLGRRELEEILSSYDFEVYLHAPFSDLNIASLNRTVLEESTRSIKRALEIASQIEASVATAHFGRYSPLGLSYPERALEQNRRSVEELSAYGEGLDVTLAFENSPKGFGVMYGSYETIKRLVEETDIRITLDLGHANTWDGGVEEFVTGLNNHIYHTHLHDNTGESDMHLGLGKGEMDLKKSLGALKKISYKRALCLETLYEEDLMESRESIKKVLEEI